MTSTASPSRGAAPPPSGAPEWKEVPVMLQILTESLLSGALDTLLSVIDIISWED